MNQIIEYMDLHPIFLKVIVSFAVIFVAWSISGMVIRILHKKIDDVQLFHRSKKTMQYITFSIIAIIMIGYWSDSMSSMSTYLGLLSAGIAIALKDLVVNVASWFFIVWRKPFKVGDRIEIGGISGDVIDQRIIQFTLMEIGNWVDGDQSTGRVIHIPNYKVLSEPMANFSQGFQYIWNEIHVLVTFESDWQKAKSVLSEIVDRRTEHLSKEAEERVKRASKRYMIYYSKLTPIVYTSVKSDGVQLSIRYLCEPRKRRTTVQEIWEEILIEFEKHSDVELAYSTQRVIVNN